MTTAHFIYIPGIVLLGVVIGYILGGRAAKLAGSDEAGKGERRAARQRAREARERAGSSAGRDDAR
ncbi:MAG: hypothetical protein K0V04_01815 [Deltaproteobacteria bacterium]|nr:hypothetical protein [Deltaproteobacteria bacterium]